MRVRKETEIPRTPPTPSTAFYLSGPNSWVNNNSVAASVILAQIHSTQLFDALLAALDQVADQSQRELIYVRVEEMEAAQGTPSFLSRYQAFMQSVANQITMFALFIPGPTSMIG